MRRHVPLLSLAAAGATVFTAVVLSGSVQGEDQPITRGARIAALGNGHGAPACASCHGFNGSGDPSGAFPRLTGQPAHYLWHALTTFANGERRNPVMSPIASALTEAERQDVATYFASPSAPVPPFETLDTAAIERGRVIANVGLNDQQIPACVSCHGPSGRSTNPTVPALAGQYKRSTVFELQMFSQQVRRNDQMNGIAHSLTEQQRADVASYFQQVDPDPKMTAATAPTGPTRGSSLP